MHEFGANSAWVIRGGRNGEYEEDALLLGIALIGWQEVSDLSLVTDFEAMREHVTPNSSLYTARQLGKRAQQLFAFSHKIQVDDLVAMPLKQNSDYVAVGKVTTGYQYNDVGGTKRHTLSIDWLRQDIVKAALPADISSSLNSKLTVYRMGATDAYRRLSEILGAGQGTTPLETDADNIEDVPESIVSEDTEEQILDHIRSLFREHRLAKLVDAVLKADGYTTEVSSPGPDGGVDILASRGALGLDPPRICVQVKGGSNPTGVADLRRLQGVVSQFNAAEGLFVSWNGYTKPALREVRRDHFTLRLWRSYDLVRALCHTYERLPHDVRVQVPLKQIWILDLEDSDG